MDFIAGEKSRGISAAIASGALTAPTFLSHATAASSFKRWTDIF